MTPPDPVYPAYPPGMSRRIVVHAAPGLVSAGLEDDVHRFRLGLAHAGGIVTGVDARVDRFPWSTCPGAGDFLADGLTGRRLEDIAALDPAIHCTHLFELAIVAAALAGEDRTIVFDMTVADRVDTRTTATLFEDGVPTLCWQLTGLTIDSPDGWAGRDLRRLSAWRSTLDPASRLRATMLRRVVHISGARRQPVPTGRAADRGPGRLGACFTYQLPRAQDAVPSGVPRIDFSTMPTPPLAGFDPAHPADADPGAA